MRIGCLLLAACWSALLSSCTLWGTIADALIDSDTPGPYEFHGFEGSEHPGAAAELPGRYALRKKDLIQLKLRNGNVIEGRYAGVAGPTAQDPQSYILLDRAELVAPSLREQRAEGRLDRFAASDVREVGIEVTGHGWISGMLIGVVVDVVVCTLVLSSDINVQ
jgi:hypothetical protein